MPWNEFDDAYSTAFDALQEDIPAPRAECWPVSWACAQEFADSLPETTRAFAEAMAAQVLRTLTGYRVGGCAVTVRPCSERCRTGGYLSAPVSPGDWAGAYGGWGFNPYVGPGGVWLNACGCKNDSCSCTKVEEVILPGVVGRIDEVGVDGQVLPREAYRVDDFNRLTRIDGGQWPSCQDMDSRIGEPGAFWVTYLNGAPVDGVGAYVAGLLAVEFAKSCQGAACALPSNVTSVTRGGVTMQLDAEQFAGGTGLQVVDQYVQMWNPYRTQKADVFLPDERRGRLTTLGVF